MSEAAASVLAGAVRQLTEAAVPGAARDARRLLAHVMQVDAGRLTLALDREMSAEERARYEELIARRCKREPVSHLTGVREFYGRRFKVTPDVLDPRPETEILIEAALSVPFKNMLDLGTGSGCILLTLLAENPMARGVGVDLSDEALDVAEHNARALALDQRAAFHRSHWFDEVQGIYDLIVANPPYIADYEMEDLAPEVRDYEPRMALTDEADGLEAYRAIFQQAEPHMTNAARLIVEIGHTQADDVVRIANGYGFGEVAVLQDLDGRDRVVVCVSADFPV